MGVQLQPCIDLVGILLSEEGCRWLPWQGGDGGSRRDKAGVKLPPACANAVLPSEVDVDVRQALLAEPLAVVGQLPVSRCPEVPPEPPVLSRSEVDRVATVAVATASMSDSSFSSDDMFALLGSVQMATAMGWRRC